jgi:hypothetical protein
MGNTPRLSLPYIAQGQAQKEVTHNDALNTLDALVNLYVLDRDLSAPPGSPADGDTYLVKATGTDDWAGQDGKIAFCLDGGWRFFAPAKGLIAYVADEQTILVYTGSEWAGLAAILSLQNLSLLGVNTTADTTNKLAVKSSAILFDNEGNGVQFKVNKKASSDTASLLFQTDYSGRAEVGLTGDDDFHFKVSPDGSSWTDAIKINRTNGGIVIPKLGIGTTPVNVLDAVQTANGASMGSILNDSDGSAASARWAASNGTGVAWVGVLGQSFGSFGVYQAGTGMVFASTGLSLTADSGPIRFAANGGNEVARFGTDGRFQMTGPDSSNGQAISAVNSSGTEIAYLSLGRNYNLGTAGQIALATPSGGGSVLVQAGGSGGVQLTSGSASWSAISDAHFKHVRSVQTDYRSAIQALWVGDFDWKKDGSFGFGVLAQQAYDALPDGLRDIIVNKPAQDDGAWTAAAEPVGYLALWGVKDIYSLAEALSNRVAALEARIAALEAAR